MRLMLFYDRPERLLDILQRRAPDVEIACCTDYESLPRMIAAQPPEVLYTIRFGGTPRYPRQAILDSPSLRWVSVGGSGTDHLAPWDPQRLTVTNAAGVGAPTMAQYAIAAMLHFNLGLPGFAEMQRRRHWDSAGKVASVEGRTLAILGLGKTGQATARLAKALGLRVLGVRAHPAPTPDVDRVFAMGELHEVLPEADFLLVCGATDLGHARPGGRSGLSSPQARRGADRRFPRRHGAPGGAHRSTSIGEARGRGPRRIRDRAFAGDNPLWGMANVILTPHCSSVYDGWDRRSMEMFCDNLDRWRQGLPLENVVDPARGY